MTIDILEGKLICHKCDAQEEKEEGKNFERFSISPQDEDVTVITTTCLNCGNYRVIRNTTAM